MKNRILLSLLLLYIVSIGGAEAQTANGPLPGGGYTVASEGAWCWFADPRALHYENASGTINKTYIGYIDIHGNIKAMQYDFKRKRQDEVLVRSYFQPDDHNNPTFLVLPDERIMIFYSRHTDEPCFYYRVSRLPGDITTLGEEKIIKTKNNTTYPSPFILSDDPEYIYLCWRGIGWHPTIAKLSLPDEKDDVDVVWGPYQIVKSTGARPYAKYMSNGKDRIYLTYTTGHPDNEMPNFLYFNYIDINSLTLHSVTGNLLTTIKDNMLKVNKSSGYAKQYLHTLVDDDTASRAWVWQVAADKQGNPVIAMVRISEDKTSHDYYYARWNGQEWKKTFLAHAGGHFHQTPDIEKCYSAGMAIDPARVDEVYCSVPVEGKYGKVYEIVKFTLDDTGTVVKRTPVTSNSKKNNVRPYMIPQSEKSPLRLTWMYGDYYDWIVSKSRPQGYCTEIACDFKGFAGKKDKRKLKKVGKDYRFNPEDAFVLDEVITLDERQYDGKEPILQLGDLTYVLKGGSLKPEVKYKDHTYAGTNVLGTADVWQEKSRGTSGHWYSPQKYEQISLRMEYKDGVLTVYINGLLDQKIKLK